MFIIIFSCIIGGILASFTFAYFVNKEIDTFFVKHEIEEFVMKKKDREKEDE